MKRRLIFSLAVFVFLNPVPAPGRTGGTVKGVLVDEATNKPIQFVNVLLRRTQDSAMVAGQVSDGDGKFAFSRVPDGEYLVDMSLIGYEGRKTRSFLIDPIHENLNLGELALTATAVDLEEVLVSADKSIFNNSIDRKVYNVERDLMSKAGSASELLQNVPSVQVDIDGNVSLRGSGNVLIMLNGKTSALMDRSSAEVLQQMPASSIERIEVITNPSAKFRPDGTSGIINIVLKKNAASGINGNITGNGGNGGRYNGNIRLNVNPGEYNFYITYSLRKDNRNRTSSDARKQLDATSNASYYNGDLISGASPLSHMLGAGLDLRADGGNELGISGNYFINTFTRTDDLAVVLRNASLAPREEYVRSRYDPEYEKEYGVTGYAEHIFSKEDQRLRLELTASRAPEEEDNHFTNAYRLPSASTSYDKTLIQQDEKRYQASLEYSDRPDGASSLEAGYSGEIVRSDFDFHAASYDAGQNQFVSDSTRTNRFLYDGRIHALYATFSRSLGSFGLQGGLRGEGAFISTDLTTRGIVASNEYYTLYPTLHLSYKVNPGAELQVSYSKRVNRPRGEDLNPFPEYRDPRNISAGNPSLLPEYSHMVELGCQFQNELISVLPALYYRYTYNRFTSVTQAIDDSTLLTTRQNLSNGRSGGLEIVVSANIGGLFSAHWSANAYRDQIDASNLGYAAARSATTWSSNLTFNADVAKGSRVQMNSTYNSPRLTPQGEYVPTYVVNLGFKQDLFDGKLSLLSTLSDVFKTQKRQLELATPLLNQTVVSTRDSRIFYLGLTYHFGVQPKKAKEDQLKYENGE